MYATNITNNTMQIQNARLCVIDALGYFGCIVYCGEYYTAGENMDLSNKLSADDMKLIDRVDKGRIVGTANMNAEQAHALAAKSGYDVEYRDKYGEAVAFALKQPIPVYQTDYFTASIHDPLLSPEETESLFEGMKPALYGNGSTPLEAVKDLMLKIVNPKAYNYLCDQSNRENVGKLSLFDVLNKSKRYTISVYGQGHSPQKVYLVIDDANTARVTYNKKSVSFNIAELRKEAGVSANEVEHQVSRLQLPIRTNTVTMFSTAAPTPFLSSSSTSSAASMPIASTSSTTPTLFNMDDIVKNAEQQCTTKLQSFNMSPAEYEDMFHRGMQNMIMAFRRCVDGSKK